MNASSPVSKAILTRVLLGFLLTWGACAGAASDEAEELEMDPAMCDQLADLPNAPMSVDSCKAMMRMGEDQSGNHRPGDEAMSCDDIFAELRTMQGEGVSQANIAQTDAVIAEGRALGAQHAAEMARQMTPSPLALVSALLPNAVGAALMAPEQARQVAAMARLKAADANYSAALGEHMDANIADVAKLMDDNPRLPRLAQLAMDKQCQPPPQ